MPGKGGFHAEPSTIEAHAGRVEDRAAQLHTHASAIGGTSMSSSALGPIGGGLAGTMTSHYQQAGSAVHAAGDQMTSIASTERANASAYRNSDAANAARFTSIMPAKPEKVATAPSASVTYPVKVGNDIQFQTLHPGDKEYDEKLNQKLGLKSGKFREKFRNNNVKIGPLNSDGELSGFDIQTAKPIRFNSSDVYSEELRNSKNELVGVVFPTMPGDSSERKTWAKQQNPNWTSEYYPVSQDNKWRNEGSPVPWRGSQPIVATAHGNEKFFAVLVNGQMSAVDGKTYGQILASNKYYQQAAGGDPQRPLLLLSCHVGHPEATAAPGAVDYLHSNGDGNRPVYAPTGGLYMSSAAEIKTSGVGVVNETDSNGNQVPAGFTSYPPSVPKPNA